MNENYDRLLAAYENLEAGRYDAARAEFEALGALGEHQALLYLGSMYERGLGVEIDQAAAAAFYGTSCAAGNTKSCFFLGLLKFRNGDFEGALGPYRIAADAGHPAAAYWIAQIYGDIKNPRFDKNQKIHYLKIASKRGHVFATRDLAKINILESKSLFSKLVAFSSYLKSILKGFFIILRDADDPRVQ